MVGGEGVAAANRRPFVLRCWRSVDWPGRSVALNRKAKNIEALRDTVKARVVTFVPARLSAL